jgi:hypothetical protein
MWDGIRLRKRVLGDLQPFHDSKTFITKPCTLKDPEVPEAWKISKSDK